MPEKKTIEKARKAKRAGKSPTTQAGEFVRQEIHKIRRGEHGARSPEQAIAIGLSKARRAGVKLPPQAGKATAKKRATKGRSKRRSRASLRTLRKEGRKATSRRALARQARGAAKRKKTQRRSRRSM